MTAQKEVPGADAVYLYREEVTDDVLHSHTYYVRLKILTEAGKEQNTDVVPRYYTSAFGVTDVQGRTIHSDGTVIPFTGTPFEKVVANTTERFGGEIRATKVKQTVFTMPDVQVGSILEYRYTLRYYDRRYVAPEWRIQQPYFVRKAHFGFVPSARVLLDSHGQETNDLLYTRVLPPGAEVKYLPAVGSYELDVENVPPIVREESMPPMSSLSYRVLFFYSGEHNADDYWKNEGKYWSKDVDRFANSSKLKDAVSGIVSPHDTDQEKVAKIYDAVMSLDNLDFSHGGPPREHTVAEELTKTAVDVWAARRGNQSEISRLFLGLTRAAGLKAYSMLVTDRSIAVFAHGYLTMDQFDDEIVIVVIDGKEVFLDPGERFCQLGQLKWTHTSTEGLRQTDRGTALTETPGASVRDAVTSRLAELTLAADGSVTGSVTITMSGVPALAWRQSALRNDESEFKKRFEDSVQSAVAPGVVVRLNHFLNLTDPHSPLMARMDVSGNLGAAAGGRISLPGSFFESGELGHFSAEKRQNPVDLEYPRFSHDTVKLQLPEGFRVGNLPPGLRLPFEKNAAYETKYSATDRLYTLSQDMVINQTLYAVNEYPSLRDFFQKTDAEDRQKLVLTAAGSAAGGK